MVHRQLTNCVAFSVNKVLLISQQFREQGIWQTGSIVETNHSLPPPTAYLASQSIENIILRICGCQFAEISSPLFTKIGNSEKHHAVISQKISPSDCLHDSVDTRNRPLEAQRVCWMDVVKPRKGGWFL